jgi:putative ABC transport system permease protein
VLGARHHEEVRVAQVSAAFVLLIGAGLLLASFRQALTIDPGFAPDGVLTASVSLPDARYDDGAARRRFTDDALRRLRAVPGVARAGATTLIPLGDDFNQNVIFPEGFQVEPGESLIAPFQSIASPGYFEAMQIPLVAGRFFNERDVAGEPRAVIVDEELARRYWPGLDPVGRRMFQPQDLDALDATDESTVWHTVVGVTRDVRLRTLIAEEDEVGAFYMPLAQTPRAALTFTVRTDGDPLALAGAVRAALAEVDPVVSH